MGGDLGAVCHPALVAPAPDCKGPRQPRAAKVPATWYPNLTAGSGRLRGTGVPTHTPRRARAGVTLPSTTGGVLLVGGASGVVVGGKRTLKSQNWDVGCRSSDSVSNATPAPLLPMASSAGILRMSPSKTAFYIFYAGPAKRHPGLQGRGELQGAGRGGEEGRGGPKDWPCGHAMSCQGSPVVPRGSPCPEGHINLAASRCLGVPLPCAGVVAATHFPCTTLPG